MISRTRPTREFVVNDSKPNLLGIRATGTTFPTGWHSRETIQAEIRKLEDDLRFWKECNEQFDEEWFK